MAEQTQPDKLPRWATDGGALVTEPSEGKKDAGWVGEMPSANAWNWLKLKTYEWLTYLSTRLLATAGLQADTELTIASGSITPTQGNHSVDTQADAASDDLANIVTTNLDDGRLLIIRAVHADRTVVVKHAAGGAGQIHLQGGVDLSLEDTETILVLKRTGADWYEVSRSNQKAGLVTSAQIVLQSIRHWFSATATEANSWSSVAWSPTLQLFVAVAGSGTNRVMYSRDGVNWTAASAAEANAWEMVIWVPELAKFVAVSSDGTNRVMYSANGTAWTAAAAAEANAWRQLTWSPSLGRLVAVATSGTNRVMYSADAITWTAAAATEANSWSGVTWSEELTLFVAVASDGTNRVMTSPDGITWSIASAAEASAWTDVIWVPELAIFVACCATVTTNRVMYSANGTAWTAVPTPAFLLQKIVWSPEFGVMVAVGSSGLITSPDGITWTSRPIPEAIAILDIEWSPALSLFVGVASSGTSRVVYSL